MRIIISLVKRACEPPRADGLLAARRIRARHPETAIVLLSHHGETEHAVQLLQELPERVGYLLKERTASARALLEAIERVAGGGVVIDPEVVTRLIRRPRPRPAGAPHRARTGGAGAHGRGPLQCDRCQAHEHRGQHGGEARHRGVPQLGLSQDGTNAVGSDNARVRAVLTFLRHTGRLAGT